ncbi:MAG TPA: AGE family epimerase/isomerase [Methylomirabilota bacterium]|nr:AGE family epimerase/isomerase [Methylomirabilota bacterium]
MRSWYPLLSLLCVALLASPGLRAEELAVHAARMQRELAEKILPYWHDTAQDSEHEGYLLADDAKGRGQAKEKQLVSQTRMIWTFSLVHRRGFSHGSRNYLEAARQGWRFLDRHFLDRERGGYYWKTDLAGHPISRRKNLYGQAFALYALVEFHRASGDRTPLHQAIELFRVVQEHAHDRTHGGWLEHFDEHWKPLLDPALPTEVEVAGYKSANAHLHWMEALTELYEATRETSVRAALAESLRINQDYFYPLEPGRSCFHRQRDWKPVTDPRSAGLSYGHNVEFAWLMIRAEQVLGRQPSWPHFHAHLRHALKFGYDHERGGLYNRGVGNEPAGQTDKVWWAQAEMMAALTDGLRHEPNPEYRRALDQLIHFVWKHQVDARDGIWLDTVTADGQPKITAKAHSWKANYHDVRALLKFIDAFGTTGAGHDPARP